MYVKNEMTTDVVTVFPEASLTLAFQLMVESGYSQLPVIKDNKLIGMITEQVLSEFSPSKATTLSVYELNYVLSKTKCKDIMIKDPLTCTKDMFIEEAAILLRDNDIDAIPVVNENNTLEGIITRTDIINAFLQIVGANDIGTKIIIEAIDELGTISKISSIIKEHGINITNITNYFYKDGSGNGEIIIRVRTTDSDELIEDLKNNGFNIISVVKSSK